jgi:hypothetical protein
MLKVVLMLGLGAVFLIPLVAFAGPDTKYRLVVQNNCYSPSCANYDGMMGATRRSRTAPKVGVARREKSCLYTAAA